MKNLAVIILAAGKGARMKSDLPKVFHEILGEPMLTHVLKTVGRLDPAKILVVVGHQREMLMDHYREWPVEFVVQAEQKGTGHAVMQAAVEETRIQCRGLRNVLPGKLAADHLGGQAPGQVLTQQPRTIADGKEHVAFQLDVLNGFVKMAN